MSYRQRRLYKMWAANPSCHWCERITRLVRVADGIIPDDAGTEDHVYNRLQPEREFDDSVVLACAKCNHARGRAVDIAVREAKRKAGHREAKPRRLRPLEPFVTVAELDRSRELERLQKQMKRGYNREIRVRVYEVGQGES